MAGNVWEWVEDRYGGFNAEPEIDPTGAAKGEARVIRGGYWGDSSQGPRASSRGAFMPDGRAPAIGFRVARNP
jgi:formylglycine-generating enzyme required for sulfatase activity